MRPDGDEIAANYGDYFDSSRISAIRKGDRYEALCKDGLNYVVEVKDFSPETNIGHLHFPRWKTKYDYKGNLEKVYLVEEGTYSSEGKLTLNNTYELDGGSSSKRLQNAQRSKRPPSTMSSYAANTRYDEDYFAKPRPRWAKKRRSSGEMKESESSGNESEPEPQNNNSSDSEGIKHVRIISQVLDFYLFSIRCRRRNSEGVCF
jgi:hypothetical protein